MMSARWLFALVPAVILACARPQLGPGEMSNSQFISEDEVAQSRESNAYDVIHKLRANFLSYRGETSFDKSRSAPYPTVYLDGQEFGSINILRTIPTSEISSIRLYRSWEATTKFGTGNMGGVIAITTRQ
jgi:hypothetical protein